MQQLLDQKYLKAKSLINGNVDFEMISPIIDATQELKIKPLLGTNLYDRVVYESTPTGVDTYANLSTAIRNLLEGYIQPAMNWYIQADLLLPLKFRSVNKGVMEKNSSQSQAAATSDVQMLEQRYLNKAENYGSRMARFIEANQTLYPEYFTNTGIDKIFPDRKPFKSPIYTGRRRREIIDYSNVRNASDNPVWLD